MTRNEKRRETEGRRARVTDELMTLMGVALKKYVEAGDDHLEAFEKAGEIVTAEVIARMKKAPQDKAFLFSCVAEVRDRLEKRLYKEMADA